MNTEFLTRLYWACSDQNRHLKDGLNPGKLYERIEDTENADHAFSDSLYATVSEINALSELEDLHINAYIAYEKQGFINGFRLGMLLREEITI